jgi:hypothetical protein
MSDDDDGSSDGGSEDACVRCAASVAAVAVAFDALPPDQRERLHRAALAYAADYAARYPWHVDTSPDADHARAHEARARALAAAAAERDDVDRTRVHVMTGTPLDLTDGFLEELARRTGVHADDWVCDRDTDVLSHRLADPLCVRTHPTAVALLRERGGDRPRGRVSIHTVPRVALGCCSIRDDEGYEVFVYRPNDHIAAAARAVLADGCIGDVREVLRRAVADIDAVPQTTERFERR